jgi:hypothetical protein
MDRFRTAFIVVLCLLPALTSVTVVSAQERSSLRPRADRPAIGTPVFFADRADLEQKVLERWAASVAAFKGGMSEEALARVLSTIPQSRLAAAAVAGDTTRFLSRLAGAAPPEPRFTDGFPFFDQTFVPVTPCRIIDTRLSSIGEDGT